MKRLLGIARSIRPGKKSLQAAILLSPPFFYVVIVVLIHTHNARYQVAYENLSDAALANGLLVHHFNRPQDPPGLNRFYDENATYKGGYGLTYNYVGYKDDDGNIVLPAIYKGGNWHFYEGLNYAYTDGRLGFIKPDGSWAFVLQSRGIRLSNIHSFFNGRAIVMKELHSSRTTPQWRYGAIDKQGNIVIDLEYLLIKEFIGEPGNEYTLAAKKTVFHSIYESLMDGIDISIGLEYPLPPRRLVFLDREGNQVGISRIRRATHTLKETAP